MNKTTLFAVAGVASLLVFVCLWLNSGTSEITSGQEEHSEDPKDNIASKEIATKQTTTPKRRTVKRPAQTKAPLISTEERTDLSPADKKYLLGIESAIDAEDLEALRNLLDTASSTTNAEIRAALVDALGWFGDETLVELTPFMADEDEDVAEAARSAWELALSDLASPKEKLVTALMALETIANKDSLASIGALFANVAIELIDGPSNEETANERRTEIVLAVENLINSDKKTNSEAAREIFEDITGHEYVSSEETQVYLSDPDNYESPEERETKSPQEEYEYRTTKSSRSKKRSSASLSSTGSSELQETSNSIEGFQDLGDDSSDENVDTTDENTGEFPEADSEDTNMSVEASDEEFDDVDLEEDEVENESDEYGEAATSGEAPNPQ